jgi:hypothetical protein
MDIRISMREEANGRWLAESAGAHAARGVGSSSDRALANLRRSLARTLPPGGDVTFVVQTVPRLAGVAEAARIMGWD